ncbi:MAG: oxaloacetate decarboxylase subunit gamma [Syntrophomonadaceae bacterium]
MVEWDLALQCFVAGVVGVFLVMALLQVAVVWSSKLAISLESRNKKDEVSQAGKS